MIRTHDDIQDELLILQCQAGDAKALTALVERWQPRLLRFAWRLTFDREAASDVAQESWLGIVKELGRLQDPANFRPWAYRIVRNKCADWVRRRAVRRKAAQSVVPLQSEPAQTSDEDVETMTSAMRSLPEQQRLILSLHYLDGMPLAEIGRVLDVSEGTVKSRLFHARNRLKQAMERIQS